MGGLKGYKVKEVIKLLESLGWVLVRQNGGSHRTFKKSGEQNILTLTGHPQETVSPGIMSQLRRKAGIEA